jgi:hypothetical protein
VVWVNRDADSPSPDAGEADSGQNLQILDHSLLIEPTHRTYLQLRLATVPQTLILAADGRVEYVRAGVVDEAAELALSNFIDQVAHGQI